MNTYRRLDELSLNAWAAPHVVLLDGWVLRYANGYTKRANSVNALYGGQMPLGDKIKQCEMFYGGKGLPTVFRLANFSQPEGLDGVLAAQGYEQADLTNVQTLKLGAYDGVGILPAFSPQPPLNKWMFHYQHLSGQDDVARGKHEALLGQGLMPAFYTTLSQNNQVVSCGALVLEGGYAGIFDIITHPNHRNQGHARQLVQHMLTLAQTHNSHTAYLQVMTANKPANHLYETMGFKTIYQYWYQIKR